MPEPDETKNLRRQIGEALARLRESRGLTEVEVAQHMSRDSSDISRWERGETPLPAEDLWRYLRVLDAPFSDFQLELEPEAANPRLREIASQLDAMG